jgi:glutaredoxin
MIIIYALKECNKCREIIRVLSQEKISYKVIYDNEQEEFFDLLEENLKTTSYPIIEINKVEDIFYVNNIFGKDNNRSYIVYMDSISNLPFVKKYNSINQAIELIKKEYET